jgi:hypothetical protein
MKKFFFPLFFFIIFSAIFISCSDPSSSSVGSSGSITHTYIKTTPPVNINNGNTNDFVNVPDTGNVSSLIYSLDSIVNVDVTKIDIILMHNNIYDTLIHNLTNPGNNFIGTKFSDQSPDSIKNGNGNYTGTYKPYRPLSVFNGQSIIGQWFIFINYWGAMKSGVIKSWGITITYNKVTTPSGEIVPLAVNNQWIWDLYSDTTYYGKDTVNIIGSSVIHGKQVSWWKENISSVTWYFRNESDGMWNYGNSQDTTSPYMLPHLFIKYPINVNETYYTHGWMSANDTVTCVSTNATFAGYSGCIQYYELSNQKKDFDNIYYHNLFKNYSPNTVYNTYTYLKPGIGIVGIVTSISSGTSTFTITQKLVKYTLH